MGPRPPRQTCDKVDVLAELQNLTRRDPAPVVQLCSSQETDDSLLEFCSQSGMMFVGNGKIASLRRELEVGGTVTVHNV